MFKNLVSTLKGKHLRDLAAKGELVCPECGKNEASILEGEISTLRCDACGVTSLPEEWISAGKGMAFAGDADSPPPATKIVRNDNGAGTITWRIPASGQGCFLLFFSVFWCSITAVVSGGFLLAELSGRMTEGDGFPKWALIPFFAIFWAVGIAVLYAGLRERYARHLLTMDGRSITLRRDFFGHAKDKSIDCGDIESIAQKEFYQQNYKPVYGIEIKGRKSKIRFGTALEMDDKSWLVADLRKVVKAGARGEEPASAQEEAAGQADAGIRLSVFSFSLPVSWRSSLPFALTCMVMGSVFVWIGCRFLNPESPDTIRGNEPLPFWLLENLFMVITHLFRAIWIAIWTAAVCAGIWMVTKYFSSRHEEIHLEANAVEVAIRRMKHGRVHEERSFPRTEVTGVRSTVSGATGSLVKKRVMLIVGEKSEKIAGWVDAPVADEFVRQVNEALG